MLITSPCYVIDLFLNSKISDSLVKSDTSSMEHQYIMQLSQENILIRCFFNNL